MAAMNPLPIFGRVMDYDAEKRVGILTPPHCYSPDSVYVPPTETECVFRPLSSRVCEHGMTSCEVRHTAPGSVIDRMVDAATKEPADPAAGG